VGVQGWHRYQSPLGETYGSGCAEGNPNSGRGRVNRS
jgi:hypothetical protein